jgi:cytochrome c oxidase assembly protein subunit 15
MNSALHRFAIFTLLCTVLLLAVGAIVTSTDAGDSVPDWPLAYGSLLPPLVGNILYEYGHRVMGALVGVLTIGLAAWIQFADPRGWLRRLGWMALLAVVAQGLLGGLRVLNPQFSGQIAIVHATLAQIFLCLVAGLALFTSRAWQQELPVLEDSGSPRLRTLAGIAFALTFLQLLLGAAFRHGLFGTGKVMTAILPHLLNSFVVLAASIVLSAVTRRRFEQAQPLRKAAIVFSALVGTQIILGFAAFLTIVEQRTAPQPMPVMVWVTVAHLVLGALTLACCVVLGLFAFRMTRSESAVEVGHEGKAVA